MSRVDVPTLKCDRCDITTQDRLLMMKFRKIQHSHMSGTDYWDFCPACWVEFLKWVKNDSGN